MFILDCDLPKVVVGILSILYKSILYLIPIAIVLFGIIDFLKAIASQKEDAIKGSTNTFIRRIITGLLTFFIFSIINWIFGTIIENVGNAGNSMECAAQILKGTTSTQKESADDCYERIFNECIKRTSGSDAENICKNNANKSCNTNK